jgi:single-strand DNA-binding protein
MSFNRIILVGNLGKDPELRYTPQGNPVCSFSLATNERRRAQAGGEQADITTWFRVTLWGRQAETAAQYLQKGRPVYIEGKLRVEEYMDKEGKVRHTLEVSGTDLQFIGGGGEREAEERAVVRPTPPAGVPVPKRDEWTLVDGRPVRGAQKSKREESAGLIDDDEIPF